MPVEHAGFNCQAIEIIHTFLTIVKELKKINGRLNYLGPMLMLKMDHPHSINMDHIHIAKTAASTTTILYSSHTRRLSAGGGSDCILKFKPLNHIVVQPNTKFWQLL